MMGLNRLRTGCEVFDHAEDFLMNVHRAGIDSPGQMKALNRS